MLNKIKKYIKFSFTLIITVSLIIFLFRRIPFLSVVSLIKGVDFKIIFLSLIISFISNILISVNRWRIILKCLGCHISWRESLLIKMGSKLINSILPMKTSELTKIFYLKRIRNISYSKSIFSITSEYLLNILTLPLFILVGLIIYLTRNNSFNLAGSIGIIYLSIFSPFFRKRGLFGKSRNKFSHNFYLLFKNFFVEFKGLLKNKSILFHTLLFVFAELINVYLLSKALYKPLPFYGILIFMPFVILVGALRITIAGLGVREAAVIFFFSRFAPSEVLLSLGLLYSFVEHLFPVIIGGGFTGIFLNRIFWHRDQ